VGHGDLHEDARLVGALEHATLELVLVEGDELVPLLRHRVRLGEGAEGVRLARREGQHLLVGGDGAGLIVELARGDHEAALPSWALTLAGTLYLSWLLSHFILLRELNTPLNSGLLASLQIEPGAAWIYFTLAITFIQDTAAYFVGRSWGRHKMAPALSPKKTWEGAIGGLVGAIASSLICIPLLGLPIGFGAGVLLGVAGGVVGPLGDLSESLIKRQVGLKDAGSIIPGHGGILDRADSLLFTAPTLYYLISIFTRN